MREFSAKLGALELVLEWRLTLFTVLLLPGLVSLGFWQLERAQEKRVLMAQDSARRALAPIEVTDLTGLVRDGEFSRLSGRAISFDANFAEGRYWLLDNRTRDGRVGYEVIALAQTASWLLPVNLGWVEGDPSRRTLPEVTLPSVPAAISGRFYLPSRAVYQLEDQALSSQLPSVIQVFDGARLAKALDAAIADTLFPIEIRVDSGNPVAFRADWTLVNQSPEKHTGYAVQWFTMAAVLGIAFLFRSTNLWFLLRGRGTHHSS